MTENIDPLLSVVIATRNAKAHLQECLDSVYAQSNPSWEIVVIDGGSTDGTVEIIQRNSPKLKHWLSGADTGVYDAWNKALPHLEGAWVMFLGADDRIWDDKVLERAAPMLSDAKLRSRIVYGRVAITDEAGSVRREEGDEWTKLARRFRKEMCIPHQGVFHRRDIFSQREFDTSFRYAGDYFLLLDELLQKAPVFLNLRVSAWRQGGLTSSARNSFDVLREFRVARAKAGLREPPPYWSELKAMVKLVAAKVLGSGYTEGLLTAYRKLRGP
jgi:glycosyltransferase involved in cell wall biosynthesis